MLFSHGKAIRELNDATKTLENGQKKILDALEQKTRLTSDQESFSSGASSILRKFDVASVVSNDW